MIFYNKLEQGIIYIVKKWGRRINNYNNVLPYSYNKYCTSIHVLTYDSSAAGLYLY